MPISNPGGLSQEQVQDLIDAALAGKGVIGTASFDASSGGIASLVNDGVITGVTYDALGGFTVAVSGQPNTNYIALADSSPASGASGNGVVCNIHTKAMNQFLIQAYDPRSETLVDPNLVNVVVLRLSQ